MGMSEKAPELKPCPFCGGAAELLSDVAGIDWWVWCESCGCKTDDETKDDAVLLWNRRADLAWLPPELTERVKFWHERWELYGDGTHELLGDILAAVEAGCDPQS